MSGETKKSGQFTVQDYLGCTHQILAELVVAKNSNLAGYEADIESLYARLEAADKLIKFIDPKSKTAKRIIKLIQPMGDVNE